MAPIIRNGNNRTALISLNITPSVSPTILKGSKISQNSGSKKIMSKAKGQHKTKRMHHKKIAIKVFIQDIFIHPLKLQTNLKTVKSLHGRVI
jgi:hypothetical protein